MDKNFYGGFEKKAVLGALKAGWGAAKGIYGSSGMGAALKGVGQSARKGFDQGMGQVKAKYPKQMASAKAMYAKTKNSATNLMNQAKNTWTGK